jgi:hypothetical protein
LARRRRRHPEPKPLGDIVALVTRDDGHCLTHRDPNADLLEVARSMQTVRGLTSVGFAGIAVALMCRVIHSNARG